MWHPILLWRDLRSYYRGCYSRDLREFYDLESRLPYFDQVSRILGAHKRRILLRWISERPVCGPILELGSGIGTLTRQLGQRGYTVVAVDISTAKTLKAKRLTIRAGPELSARVHHLVGDARVLGSDTDLDAAIRKVCEWPTLRKFEVILAADVLEHLPESPGATLRHVRALLTLQGRLFTSVPSKLGVNDPGHFWPWLPAEWERLFGESGFDVRRRKMSRICCYGMPTLLPHAMVYELHPLAPTP